MIIALQPAQISLMWDSIRHAFLQTNPPPPGVSETEYANRVLVNLMNQKYQCWTICDERDGQRILIALGITTATKELLTDNNVLHIIGLYGFRRLPEQLAIHAFNDFLTYAKNTDCVKIIAHTKIPRVVELMKLVKFDKEYETYSFPLRR